MQIPVEEEEEEEVQEAVHEKVPRQVQQIVLNFIQIWSLRLRIMPLCPAGWEYAYNLKLFNRVSLDGTMDDEKLS